VISPTRRPGLFRYGQVATAEVLADADAEEDPCVVWFTLETLTAAIAKTKAAIAACPQMVPRPGSRRKGGGIPGGSGATSRPFEMIAFCLYPRCAQRRGPGVPTVRRRRAPAKGRAEY
jgi:hypothetical protein